MNSLKSAPRGFSPGPGGWTYEHMWVLLDDADTFNLFFEAVSSFAQASRHRIFNAEVGRWDSCETICARVREGMRTISMRIVDQGWDGLRRTHVEGSHRQRTPSATIFSVDGIGAYNHMLRAAMLQRLEQMPVATFIVVFCASLVCNTFTLQLVG